MAALNLHRGGTAISECLYASMHIPPVSVIKKTLTFNFVRLEGLGQLVKARGFMETLLD